MIFTINMWDLPRQFSSIFCLFPSLFDVRLAGYEECVGGIQRKGIKSSEANSYRNADKSGNAKK